MAKWSPEVGTGILLLLFASVHFRGMSLLSDGVSPTKSNSGF